VKAGFACWVVEICKIVVLAIPYYSTAKWRHKWEQQKFSAAFRARGKGVTALVGVDNETSIL